MIDQVPYLVYESEMARLERIIKRLWITILVLIILLAGSNAAWIWYESQWTDEVTSVTQEAYSDSKGPVLVNNGGDMNYGK